METFMNSDDYSDALVQNVAKKCSNTIVIIHNAGIRLVDQWIEHPNVTALIYAHLPGQDSGRALASILFGDVSPSGKLPYTVAKNESDYEALNPSLPGGKYLYFPQSNFSEGLFTDYRHFDGNGITPRYEFGFGLTYTTFEYSTVKAKFTNPTVDLTRFPPKKPLLPGGNPSLWDVIAQVRAEITNTGGMGASEIAQLYVGIPYEGTPVKQLRGFEKKYIEPGESIQVIFDLTRKDLSVWDIVAQDWLLPKGEFQFHVGASSKDLPLKTSLAL
jgi:beta-glucosidase